MTTLIKIDSIHRSPSRLALLLIPVLLACFALPPTVRALLPPPAPDGGYPNGNTAEGTAALYSLTTGSDNTANGYFALDSNTTGNNNTADGAGALDYNTTGNLNTANGTVRSNSTPPAITIQPTVLKRSKTTPPRQQHGRRC